MLITSKLKLYKGKSSVELSVPNFPFPVTVPITRLSILDSILSESLDVFFMTCPNINLQVRTIKHDSATSYTSIVEGGNEYYETLSRNQHTGIFGTTV